MAVGPHDDGAIARPVQPRRNKQESACANRKYEYGRQEASLAPHSRTIFMSDPSQTVAAVDGLTIHRSEMCTHAAIIGIQA